MLDPQYIEAETFAVRRSPLRYRFREQHGSRTPWVVAAAAYVLILGGLLLVPSLM